MGITFEQFEMIVTHIENYHSWQSKTREPHTKIIKYINSTFDTRTRMIYRIKLETASGEIQDFAVVNENRNRCLYTWIFDWLSGAIS